MKRSLFLTVLILAGPACFPATAAPDMPARVEVSLIQAAAANPPIGCNEFGNPGGTAFSAGNLIPDSGFEPMSIRRRWRVVSSGVENRHPWAEVDGGGMTEWDLTTSGFLNEANVRIYRIVDAQGRALPQNPSENYLNLTNADRYEFAGTARVPGTNEPGLPLGGWVNTLYTIPASVWGTRASLNFTDARWIENGRAYFYIVTAIGNNTSSPDGLNESDPALATELTATPLAGLSGAPRIFVRDGDGFNEIGSVVSNGWMSFAPGIIGATGTVTWALLNTNNQPITPPAGLSFDAATGELGGTATLTPPATRLRFRATAANGTATRDFILNNPAWTPTGGTNRPAPPASVTATAGDGHVYLSWTASPTPGVVGYRVYRSEVPRSQQRQRVYFDTNAPALVKDDYLHFSKRILTANPAWAHPRVRSGRVEESWRSDSGAAVALQRVPHPGAIPPAFRFPGESCMRAACTNGGLMQIGGPYIFYPATGGEGEWYSQLEPGRTYRYEAWMRQEGLANSGRVWLGLGSFYEDIGQATVVTTNWQLVGFSFVAPARPTNSAPHSCPVIQFTGPGALWFDNIRLFRADTAADATNTFTPSSPLVFDELLASQPTNGGKGMLRSMGVLLNQASMASALGFHRDAGLTMNWYQSADGAANMTVPLFLQYALRTGSSPSTRMTPWLNVSSHMSEAEWLMLVEYLGAPINPGDPADVAAKPWAWLRCQQRGIATPWTDEFSRIHLEFANETWHNGMVSGEWFGWGRTDWVHDGALEFGLAARHFTTYVQDHSPFWSALNAAGKLRFVMGSNYEDYGEKAASGAPLAHAIGHTTYVGPKWEVGETPLTTFDDHGIQATLLGNVADTEKLLANYRRQREQLAAAGHVMDLLAYEGGPSGYALPGQDTPTQYEYSERYGKSLAMGVAALDAWLSAYEHGFSDQAFLGFAIGDYWSSHTTIASGYRPHAGWLAMALRNRFASGRMVRTAVTQSPTISWDGGEYPLVAAYVFRNGSRLCVFLLSRKLAGVHDGVDWGDGSTPVTLALPADPTGPATLYRLTGDPRVSNRDAMNVAIQQSTITLARETVVTLPQGSIHLYVVDTRLPERDDPLPSPGAPTTTPASAGTTLHWPAVEGASGYVVFRSAQPWFDWNDVAETFHTTTNQFTDTGAVGGTTCHYRVATSNAWGIGFWSLVAAGGLNPATPALPTPVLHSLSEDTGKLVASWEEVPGATGYSIGLGSKSGGPYTWTDAGIALNWTFSGLSNGATYYVSVFARSNTIRSADAPGRTGIPLAAGQTAVLAAWDADVLVYSGHLDNPPLSLPVSRHLLSLDASDLTRGPGLELNTDNYGFDPGTGDDGGCHYDKKMPFLPTSDDGNFGATGGGSLSNAIQRNLYVGCTLTPVTGQSVSICSLDTGFQYSFGSHPLQVVLRYRIGTGGWHEVSPPGYSVTNGFWLFNDLSLVLTDQAALRNVQQPVELRLYVFWTGDDARWHPAELVRSSGEDLVIRGRCQTLGAPGKAGGLRSAAGMRQVTLSWIPVAGAASYTVRWGAKAGGPYTNSLTGLTQSAATLGNLASGQPCYFTVEAVNSFGAGAASAEGSSVSLPVILDRSRAGDGLRIAWPGSVTNWVLQSTAKLGTPWTNMSVSPLFLDGQWAITMPVTGATRFYRLGERY